MSSPKVPLDIAAIRMPRIRPYMAVERVVWNEKGLKSERFPCSCSSSGAAAERQLRQAGQGKPFYLSEPLT